MESEVEASGLRWWDEQLAQRQVSFRAALFPALLGACDVQSLPAELSRDELRVVTQFCISADAHQSDLVTKEEFRRFLARFGPLESSLSKLVACFCVNRELVSWFHGEIGRQEAEAVLAARERSDGAFLVRFSESHPTKFTLTYLKVHSPSSRTPGRREVKNCLVRNLGASGYALTESVRRGGSADASVRQRTYPSIGAFIQSSSGRLKYGVTSDFSKKCNQELASVRAMQDQQSDSYSAFSTESFGKPELPPSMLFSQSPPSQSSFLGVQSFNWDAENKGAVESDSYASFTLESLAPPVIHQPTKTVPVSYSQEKSSTSAMAPSSEPFASKDYGSFASIGQHQPEEEAQPTTSVPAIAPAEIFQMNHLRGSQVPPVSDEYASFATLAASYSHESRDLASRAQHAISFSRSPTCAASPTHPRVHGNEAYGSFASIAVTKPAPASTQAIKSPSPHSIAASDYGSFASLANDLEEKKPQWEEMLGPPPPPVVVKSRPDNQKTSADTDIYGNLASLSLETGVTALQSSPKVLQQTSNRAAPLPAPSSDVYGSFDGTAAAPAVKTTPITSALDELNVGMEFYKQKRLDDALLRFMLAQEMARATADQVVEARALGNLGTVYLDKKNPQQAVRCYQHCLDITRAIEDTKRERTILNNLVLALVASEDFERALACCQVQLETTTNAINRRKIISRMSLLREQLTRRSEPKA